MKKVLLTTIFLFIILFSFSQSANFDIWDNLLSNKREAAIQSVKTINTKNSDIEAIVLKQIVNNESGIFKPDPDFLNAFVTKPDFEYYLFALWKQPFIFSNYLNDGFKKQVFDNIDLVYKQNISQSQIKSALYYLQAISFLNRNNFKKYYEIYDQINAVKKWQYCGIFENLNKSGINIKYPPEYSAESATGYNANSNGNVNWYIPAKKYKDAYQFFTNHLEYGSGINYAQSFINSETEQTVIVNIGTGKAIKVWMNDILIFEQLKNRITDLDAYSVRLVIPKGNNRLLIKTTNDSYSNFIIRFTDTKGASLSNLTYSDNYSSYNKSTAENLQIKELPNVFEEYFIEKVSKNPKNIFYKFCLLNTYLRNSKEDKAREVLSPLIKSYPKSSFLRLIEISLYNIDGNYTKVNETHENIEKNDPDYYYTQVMKFLDITSIFKQDIAEMNETLDNIAAATDIDVIKHSCELFKELRNGNKSKIKKELDKLMDDAEILENAKLKTTYSVIYSTNFNEHNKTKEILKDVTDNYFYFQAYKQLAYQYNNENQYKKIVELYTSLIEKLPNDNSTLLMLINQLQDMHEYKESLIYINKALENFPYSFELMEKKGNALQQLNKENEALLWYKKSLSHNSGKSSLRNKINDLENKKNPLKEIVTDNAYDYIQENRKKITENNFGINYLLDEYSILLYYEGGYKSRVVNLFEVTSDNGIEILKEYNLGLSGDYDILKSEIVKPDGSIVPAEKSGSNLVFNDLSIGDVVYVDYEINTASYGRFYKDYTENIMFESFHPSLKTDFRVLVPDSINLNYTVVNGEIPLVKRKIENLTLFEWSKGIDKGLPKSEDFMPQTIDIARTVHVSTIHSWNDISTWYSDLVSSSVVYNNIVNETFTSLFPNGFSSISENNRAKIIYDYIRDNMKYSYVDFKQSGFIPQRPSKTISSKLGDCKDFSTLFLALGRKAGLKVNLVLVSTNDNGQNNLMLPAINFNHCIVKVNLDGKQQYLELTDKNLPFKSLPMSLSSATALEIPYKDNNEVNKNLIKLKDISQTKTILKSDILYTIYPERQDLTVTITGQGRINSYFNDILAEPNEEVLKKNILEYMESFDKLDLDLKSYKILQRDKKHEKIKFRATFSVKNKIQKLGKTEIFKLPMQLRPYTANIIQIEERVFPIEYLNYEDIDRYESNYKIVLKNNKSFSAITDNQNAKFKNHVFSGTFNRLSDTELEVKILSETSLNNITADEYPEFKKFVQVYLDFSESLIGFE